MKSAKVFVNSAEIGYDHESVVVIDLSQAEICWMQSNDEFAAVSSVNIFSPIQIPGSHAFIHCHLLVVPYFSIFVDCESPDAQDS